MKRIGHLLERVAERENLRLAIARALRGKRDRPDARAFVRHLEGNLTSIRDELLSGCVTVGHFHQFVVRDPKERVITAPCFRERVLHHALMNVCEPVFERRLIPDTYACRRGKGRIAALLRARQFADRYRFFLKLDIRKYFDSVPHDTLVERLELLFKDRKLISILSQIIRAFRAQIGVGLPIGSLTSQHLANFYLGHFDRQVKQVWRIPAYVRYMDDMLLWSNSKAELLDRLMDAHSFLGEQLSLRLKVAPYMNRSTHGVDFLGCRVLPGLLKLNRRSRVRFRRRLMKLETRFRSGDVSEPELQRRATALVAFTRAAGVRSWKFRSGVLQQVEVSGPEARTA